VVALALTAFVWVSLRCQSASPVYRHQVTYGDTVVVPESGLKDVSYYFTAGDTINSTMTVVGNYYFDWYVLRSYDFRNSPRDSLHCMYWGKQYQVARVNWYGFPADTFTFELINRGADPCTLHLEIARTYWSTDSAGP
jgi:hypothetical protein